MHSTSEDGRAKIAGADDKYGFETIVPKPNNNATVWVFESY